MRTGWNWSKNLLVLGALCLPGTSALAEAITYTFTGVGDITGTLGGIAIGGPDETLTFTFIGNTANAESFDLGSGLPHGWVNFPGTASIAVTNTATGATIAQGTFSPSDDIFVSIDNVNGGVGFGSDGGAPGSANFPGNPVYPFGLRPCSTAVGAACGATQDDVLSYDLKSDMSFTAPSGMENAFVGPGGLSCFGFPGSCTSPTALATTAGDLILGAAGSPFSVTDAATFDARTMSTPEPSTWAMMLLGFAAVGLIGYRQTRRREVATI
jgi:hypothetical protein